jgi:hypothetical protein
MAFNFTDPQSIRLPVRFDDGTEAIVRTLSASGMCVDTSSSVALGDSFTFELRPPGSALAYVATGTVVTVEAQEQGLRATIRFTDLQLRDAT